RVAVVSGEAATGEREARNLDRPVRRCTEVFESGREISLREGEARCAATVPERQIELPRAAWPRHVDARTVVAEVRQLVVFALSGCLVCIALWLADRVQIRARPDVFRLALGRGLRDHVAGRRDVDDARDATWYLELTEVVAERRTRSGGRWRAWCGGRTV